MNFNSILGQPVLVQSLKNAIYNSMISNAYIFNGVKGCGKKTAAKIFAAGINCINDKEKPCGFCTSCKKAAINANPDIIYIRPIGNNIKIEQIRELIGITSIKPYENFYRVVILENGDKMNHAAQDAFLKTLEEPEGNNVFIIITENHNSLHQTIISRCQVFNFKGVSKDVMKDYLIENSNHSPEKIEFAMEKSNGIIGRAIEILDDEEIISDDIYYNLVSELLQGKRVVALSIYDDVIKTKEEALKFLDYLIHLFKNILLFKSGSEDKLLLVLEKEKSLIREYSIRIREKNVYVIIDMIKQGIRFMDFNISTKNTMDSIFLKILEVFND